MKAQYCVFNGVKIWTIILPHRVPKYDYRQVAHDGEIYIAFHDEEDREQWKHAFDSARDMIEAMESVKWN